MAKGNPYEVLGITKDATEKDIQKAYKLQCLKWHPDKNRGNEKEAERRFIQAKEAFELLYDKERRAEHDKGVEATRVRDERQRERMEKADDKRKKFMADLKERERKYNEHKPDELTPSQLAAKRKREERNIKSDFEELSRRLFKEVEEEMKAKNEKLEAQLAEHKKQKTINTFVGKLRVKWSTEIILSELAIRKKFASYGTIVAMSPIVETKKKQKLCIIEISDVTEAGRKLELSSEDKRLFKIDWKEEPKKVEVKQTVDDDVIIVNEVSGQSGQNLESMSFDDLLANFDAKVNAPPAEKKARI